MAEAGCGAGPGRARVPEGKKVRLDGKLTIRVPPHTLPLIIGHNGHHIRHIEIASNCKMDISRVSPGEITIRYPTAIPSLLDEAREMIYLRANLRGDGSPRKSAEDTGSPAALACKRTIELPLGTAKHVIGTGGTIITSIQAATGSHLRVETTRTLPSNLAIVEDADKQSIIKEFLHVCAPREADVEKAVAFVFNWLSRVKLREQIQRPRSTTVDDDGAIMDLGFHIRRVPKPAHGHIMPEEVRCIEFTHGVVLDTEALDRRQAYVRVVGRSSAAVEAAEGQLQSIMCPGTKAEAKQAYFVLHIPKLGAALQRHLEMSEQIQRDTGTTLVAHDEDYVSIGGLSKDSLSLTVETLRKLKFVQCFGAGCPTVVPLRAQYCEVCQRAPKSRPGKRGGKDDNKRVAAVSRSQRTMATLRSPVTPAIVAPQARLEDIPDLTLENA